MGAPRPGVVPKSAAAGLRTGNRDEKSANADPRSDNDGEKNAIVGP